MNSEPYQVTHTDMGISEIFYGTIFGSTKLIKTRDFHNFPFYANKTLNFLLLLIHIIPSSFTVSYSI